MGMKSGLVSVEAEESHAERSVGACDVNERSIFGSSRGAQSPPMNHRGSWARIASFEKCDGKGRRLQRRFQFPRVAFPSHWLESRGRGGCRVRAERTLRDSVSGS